MIDDNSIIAAIDIGTTKIVALAGKKNDAGKFEILGFGSVPSKGIKRGVVLNIEDTVQSIKAAVEKACSPTGLRLNEVFVGIAGQHIKSTKTRSSISFESFDKEISETDIQNLTEKVYDIALEAGEEILHAIPQSFIVDSEVGIKHPVGMSGKNLEGNFHVVIGMVASANNIKKCVNRVGLAVNSLILEPIASAAAVLTEDEKEIGVVLVDIGGGTTDVAVFHDSIIQHTAVIPIGGNAITNDIKQTYTILERQAEELKKQYGSAVQEKSKEGVVISIPGLKGRKPRELPLNELSYIIQARMEEILHAIVFQIETSGCKNKLGAGIVICGGGSLLKNLRQLCSFITGMDVRIGYPNEHLESNVVDSINQPQFATSIGLIMKGYEYIEEKDVKSKQVYDKLLAETSAGDPENDADMEEQDEQEERPGILSKWKTKFSQLFEEDDTKF
ncbi:MAG TPA: cell division protein FtsA [Bacteroidales bacterium]|nr:cell division protein FtsA [Bacteroidales bacterium]